MSMAAKVKMLKLLQEIRGFAEISNRRPPPRSPTLVLTQIRAHGMHESLRRRKLSVTFAKPPQPDMPHQVKINHLRPDPQPAAAAQAQ
jgi:hypothetical protein